MNKPKVFVTRLIPAAGLEQVREYCDADIWTRTAATVGRRAAAEGVRLRGTAFVIDRADRRAPAGCRTPSAGGQQLRRGLQQYRCSGGHRAWDCRGKHSRCADRRHRRHGLRAVDFCRPSHRRVGEVRGRRAVEDLGADGTHRTGHGRPHVGHRRHGTHRLCDGPPVSRGLGHAGPVSRSAGPRAGRA